MIAPALFLLLPVPSPSTWTVDDDGPADFASLQAAIDDPRVVDGDRLLIQTGQYGDVVLNKALQLLGPAGASFQVVSMRVESVAEFTIAGMHATRLYVDDVPGRGRVDDCFVGTTYIPPGGFFGWSGTTEITDCDQWIATRSTFHGSDTCYPDVIGDEPGMDVRDSTVALVDCTLFGGHTDICDSHPHFGTAALQATQSDLTIAGCSLTGGDEGLILDGHPAIQLDASNLRLRGSSFQHLVQGYPQTPEGAIFGSNGSTATISGVRTFPADLPAWVGVPAEAEPWIRVVGSDTPGSSKSLELYGARGARAAAGISHVAFFALTALGPQWVGPSAELLRIVASSQDVATTAILPAGALGLEPGDWTELQALVRHRGVDVLTNPAQVILRW